MLLEKRLAARYAASLLKEGLDKIDHYVHIAYGNDERRLTAVKEVYIDIINLLEEEGEKNEV